MPMEKIVYLGVFLSDASKKKLLRRVPAAHAIVAADHVTLAFRPVGTEWDQLGFRVGKRVRLLVTGLYQDDLGQAVAVKLWGVRSENERPHITVSYPPESNARYSNALLARSKRRWKLFVLEGVCDTYPRRLGRD